MDREFKRKIVHICYGTFLAFAVASLQMSQSVILLTGILLIGSYFSMRKEDYALSDYIIDSLGRSREPAGKGPLAFTMGALVAVVLFPKPAAVLGIVFLSIGDAFSTIASIVFGTRFRLPKARDKYKTVEGLAACLISNLAAGWAYGVFPFWKVAITATAVAIAEPYVPWEMDDNLVIPALAAGLVSAL